MTDYLFLLTLPFLRICDMISCPSFVMTINPVAIIFLVFIMLIVQ
jgi:hypothetical protein